MLLVAAVGVGASGCETIRVLPDAPAAPVTDVYFYPAAGQSAAQQDRDRYDCYAWARRTSGYDPGVAGPSAHGARVIAAPPPHQDAAIGALAGGALGAALGHDFGAGVLGAVAGGVLGAAGDAAREREIDTLQHRADVADEQARAAGAYRRAMQACLAGRGYSVG